MVCDSNVIIDYLNGNTEIIALLRVWKQERRQLLIATLSITEVLGLPKLTKQELVIASQFLQEFLAVPLDSTIAHYAASLSRNYRLKVPDSLIASTAMVHDLPLVSRDRQFRKIEELVLVVP